MQTCDFALASERRYFRAWPCSPWHSSLCLCLPVSVLGMEDPGGSHLAPPTTGGPHPSVASWSRAPLPAHADLLRGPEIDLSYLELLRFGVCLFPLFVCLEWLF